MLSDKNPLISICLPTYNGEAFVKETLESVFSQSFKNYEVIICDDGSKDNTVSIIKEMITNKSNVTFIVNENNLGLVGNWNKCIQSASGKWIKFIFQDDLILENGLGKFAEAIDDSTELIVCKRNFLIDKIPSPDEKDYYENRVKTLENTGYSGQTNFSSQTVAKIAVQNIGLNFIAEPSLTMFKKDVFNKIGVFDSELKQICDLEFLLRLASNYGLKYIPEKLCAFRIHNNSTTETNLSTKNYTITYLESLLLVLKLLTKSEFKKMTNSFGFSERFKMKLYAAYLSYRAFRAIKSEESSKLFNEIKNKYAPLFFKTYQVPFLFLLTKIRS